MDYTSTDIRTIKNRHFGEVDVRHVLTQQSGMVRVAIVQGADKNCSFVIPSSQWDSAPKSAA